MHVQKAYETLKDSKKRALYDRYGEEGMEEASKFHHMHEGDGVEAAEDVRVNLEVTLAELYQGVTKDIEIERTRICEKCEGLGAPETSERKTCEQCDGKGRVLVNYGFIQTMIACDECEGKGKVIANEEDKCDACYGEGTVKEKKTIPLPLTKDMRYGGIKIPGEGNQARDHISGGCVVIIRPPANDPSGMKLLRQSDLFLLKEVPLVDALLGIKFVVNHVNGQQIALEIDSKTIVSTGDIYKLPNMGMPDGEGGFGELLIQFNIIFPKEFSDEQREHLIKALGKPTEVPSDLVPMKLTIEKTAEEIQNEDDEEEEEEEGRGGQSCVQQ
jgi:DnaJ-class molecular chaperone